MKISIVVLNWNRREELRELLLGIKAQKDGFHELIVVDNDSDDGSPEMVVKEFPIARLIRSDRNLGAVGRNLGLKAATGDLVLSLDNDILLPDPLFLDKIIRKFREDPELGVLIPRILLNGTSDVINWHFAYPLETHRDVSFNEAYFPEGATTFRRETLERAGFYPDSFFIEGEGVDLAYRVVREGYDIRYCPDLFVYHRSSPTQRDDWRKYYFSVRNHIWIAVRLLPWRHAVLHGLLWMGFWSIRGLRNGKMGHVVRGILHGIGGIPDRWNERNPLSGESIRKIRALRGNRAWV